MQSKKRGGTGADLSGTGPGYLKQATLGANVTVSSTVPASDLTGTITQARLGTGSGGAGTKFLADDQTYKTPAPGIDVSGTPTANQFAQWVDADTVQGKTLAASDIQATATDKLFGRSSSGAGAGEEITCTAAARSVLDDTTTTAMLATLGAAKAVYIATPTISYALYAVKVTTTIATDGTCNGSHSIGFKIFTGGATYQGILSFSLSGSTITGPRCSWLGSSASAYAIEIGASGGYIWFGIWPPGTGTYVVECSLTSSNTTAAMWTGGWTLSDANLAGSPAVTESNAMVALALRGAITGATTIAASSTVTASGDIISTQAESYLRTNSTDGSDNKRWLIASGSVADHTRGAWIALQGNEYASSLGGDAIISAGSNASFGRVRLWTQNTDRVSVNYDGTVTLHATTASSWRQQMPTVGCSVYRTTNVTVTSSFAAITYDAELYDSGTMHDTSSNTSRITVPNAGNYLINMSNSYWAPGSANPYSLVFKLYKNGSAVTGCCVMSYNSAGLLERDAPSASWILTLAANDYLEIFVAEQVNSAANATLYSGGTGSSNGGNIAFSVVQV